MLPNRYYTDNFSDWEDLQKQFSDYNAPANLGKEPKYIYAKYDNGGYDGTAGIIYANKKTGPYYIVASSHCSCYGLEGSWSPTEHSKKEIIRMFKDNQQPYGFYGNETVKEYIKEKFNINLG